MKRERAMKHLLIIALIGLMGRTIADAQWTRTNGPRGSHVLSLAAEDDIVLGVNEGGVVRYRLGAWEEISGNLLHSVMLAGGTAIGMHQGSYYRSTDLGATWSRMQDDGMIFPIGRRFHKMRQDTLFRSEDGGATWAPRGRMPVEADRPVRLADALYVLGGTARDTLFRSDDSGMTWRAVRGGMFHGSNINTRLAAAQGALFQLWDTTNVERSIDGGETWSDFSTGIDKTIRAAWLIGNDSATWVGTGDAVYRLNGGRWVRTDAEHTFGLPVVTTGGLVYAGYSSPMILANESNTEVPFDMGLAHLSVFALGSVGEVVVASAGNAVHRTTNEGVTWETAADTYMGRFAAKDGVLFGLGGALYRSLDSGGTWTPIAPLGGERNEDFAAIDTSRDAIFVGHGYETTTETGTSYWNNGGIIRSTDGGATWQPINNGLPRHAEGYAPVNSIVTGEGWVIISTAAGLFRSTDGGERWVPASNGIPNDGTHNASRVLYGTRAAAVVFSGVKFYRSVDGGAGWAVVADPAPRGEESYGNPVGVDGVILRQTMTGSEDGYRVFTDLYDGETWHDATDSMPSNQMIFAMVRTGRHMYGGAWHRGVWRNDFNVASVDDETREISGMSIAPNPASTGLTLGFMLPRPAAVRISMVNVMGQLVCDLFNGTMAAGAHQEHVRLPSVTPGTYFLQLEAGKRRSVRSVIIR